MDESHIRLGTSGWSYKDWIGSVYPEGCTAAKFLRVYAQQFPTVEIDSTFYGIPRESTVEKWRAETPDDFVFAAKFPQSITHETRLQDHIDEARAFIERLRDLGCRIALDDFGAGYSSFVYLKHLRADLVKIDGQFIRNLPEDRENQVFVRAIAEVARGMGAEAVAEFVESAETAELLPALGVYLMQGRYFDPPHRDHAALADGPARLRPAGTSAGGR